MPPLLSISIIAFYLSILINLFLHFQFAKKNKRFENLSSIGVLTAFTVGSFLLLNSFALKTLIALMPLTLYGFMIDFEKIAFKPLSEISSLFLSAFAIWVIFHTSFKLPLFVFVVTLLLNRIPNNTKFSVFIYTLSFILLALICQNTGNQSITRTSTLLAVSSGALIFVNIGRERMKIGHSLKYSLNFFISSLLIELLSKNFSFMH